MNIAPLKTLLVAGCLAVAATASACGDEEPVTFAPSEGTYVDVGTAAYQVQISRTLNPKAPEDRSYLVGLPAGVDPDKLKPDEQWFAVFLRAQNYGESAQTLAKEFRVVDTAGESWKPQKLAEVNQFRWNPTEDLVPDYTYPDPSSIAGTGPVRQGALLLFKLNNSIYQNRPLVLEIIDPSSSKKVAARISLDL